MQDIEPYHRWRDLYLSEDDERSPFYGRTYSEFEYSTTVYNYYIHPLWDDIGSKTLFLKVLYTDYDKHFMIIELIGEWNDAIENDIMTLKRDVLDYFFDEGIYKYILIAENVLNFHSSDREYYEEWYENVADENGWIVCLNMPSQTQYEFTALHLNRYIELMQIDDWRRYQPEGLYKLINDKLKRRLS